MKVTITVFEEAFQKLSPQERTMLMYRFHDPTIHKFFALQEEAAKEQLLALDPTNCPPDKAVEFMHRAQLLKLVVTFWQDLDAFTMQISKRAQPQENGK